MKAVVVEKPGELVIRELSTPPMGDYEARCDMICGALCAGTDTHLVKREPPLCDFVKYPIILGHESVGRVVEVGAKVRNLKPGNIITRVGSSAVDGVNPGWGGFAEIGIATDWRAMQEDGADGWQKKTTQQVLPEDIDPVIGTLFITWRETLSYVTRIGIRPGVSVLIIGSGGNGLAFAAHASNLGASRVALVGSAARAADAAKAGVTEYHDYRNEEIWRKLENGFDFAIDSVGKAMNVQYGQQSLKSGGTIGIYGLDEPGKIMLAPSKTFTLYKGGYNEGEAHEEVLKHYRAGKLNPAIWIDRQQIFELQDISLALDAVAKRTLVKPLIRIKG